MKDAAHFGDGTKGLLIMLPRKVRPPQERKPRCVLVEDVFKMLIIHVYVHVRREHVEDFRKATVQNASKSIKELGVARFDLMQQADDPTRFLLVEVLQNV